MKTVGIIGAGQLAQLLAHAAYQLGLKTLCLTDEAAVPAARNSPLFVGDLSCQKTLRAFAEQVDVITFENENIDVSVLETLAAIKSVCPGKKALLSAQQRVVEKRLFNELGIQTPAFFAIDRTEDITDLPADFPFPSILKTCRFGYDGKGQVAVARREDLAAAWQSLQQTACILEARITFDREVSLLAARAQHGAAVYYPLIENQHTDGILRQSICPYQDAKLQAQAEQTMSKLLTHLSYVGLLALELFVVGDQLYANEMAPRVHNSGHVTTECFQTGQFENHLRAITGMPLQTPQLLQPAVMHNIIGDWQSLAQLPAESILRVYDYGKVERPGRKLGHVVTKHL